MNPNIELRNEDALPIPFAIQQADRIKVNNLYNSTPLLLNVSWIGITLQGQLTLRCNASDGTFDLVIDRAPSLLIKPINKTPENAVPVKA